MTPSLAAALGAAVQGTLAAALKDPAVAITAAQPDRMAAALAQTVEAAVAADPAVQHVTNAEPWYRSRVTLGALVSAGAPLAALAIGHEVTAAEQASAVEVVMALGTIVGAGLTLYGRWVARHPIGKSPSA